MKAHESAPTVGRLRRRIDSNGYGYGQAVANVEAFVGTSIHQVSPYHG
jgi:hypothetical protein